MDLLLAQAMVVLGFLTSDQLPRIGIEALEAGADSSALRMLSGLTPGEIEDAPELFARALKELGFSMLSCSAAARVFAIAISMQILSRKVSPQDGANRIWDASIRVNDPNFHDLDAFIYAASECQSRPEEQSFFDREIIKEAESWALRKM